MSCRRSMRSTWRRSSSRSRSLSTTIPKSARPSTCASTTTARQWRRWTCSSRASARWWAAARGRSASTCCSSAWRSWGSTRRTTRPTSTSAATALRSTPASASASSVSSSTPRRWATSAMSFPSLARWGKCSTEPRWNQSASCARCHTSLSPLHAAPSHHRRCALDSSLVPCALLLLSVAAWRARPPTGEIRTGPLRVARSLPSRA
mmetsp:Transcript_48907/g.121348  ORF Transcript_48907/g.121348 Transcript_48907/m.121348 type:complete len:206 (+) Transcript_48907:1178-1795(+)